MDYPQYYQQPPQQPQQQFYGGVRLQARDKP